MEHGRFTSALLIRAMAMAAAAGGQLLLIRLTLDHLGDEAMAAWGLAWQTTIMLSLLDLGIGQAIVRLGTERASEPSFWGSIRLLMWCAGCLHAATMGIFAWIGPSAFSLGPETAGSFRWLCLALGAAGMIRYRLGLGQWLLYASADPRPAAIVDLLATALRPAVAAIACASGAGLVTMGTAAALAELAVFSLAYLRVVRPDHGPAGTAHIRAILSCGGSMTAVALLTSAMIYLSGHVVGLSLGHEGVNLYQCSTMAGLLFLRLGLLPQTVIFPKLVTEVQESGARAMIATHRRQILPYLLVCALGAGSVVALNDWFIGWWVGPQFSAGPLFAALHLAYLWLVISRTLQQTFLAAITRDQWAVVPAHIFELLVVGLLSGLILQDSRIGLAGLPMLQIAIHFLPIAVHGWRLRRAQGGSP